MEFYVGNEDRRDTSPAREDGDSSTFRSTHVVEEQLVDYVESPVHEFGVHETEENRVKDNCRVSHPSQASHHLTLESPSQGPSSFLDSGDSILVPSKDDGDDDHILTLVFKDNCRVSHPSQDSHHLTLESRVKDEVLFLTMVTRGTCRVRMMVMMITCLRI